MRIVFVIASDDQAKSAGVRIRYRRIQPLIAAAGHDLDVIQIVDLETATTFAGDVYIFSKCHDIRSVVLARAIRAAGRRVGVDFFDDYYSQLSNSRFVHVREWFRAMVPTLDFGLCSTPNMQATLKSLAPGLPCHVMNDPVGAFDAAQIAATVARNAAQAQGDRVIRIGWFGTGDNPHFTVGLQDLAAMGAVLARVRRAGYEPRLSVLTNRRAMTVSTLEMLARLPVPALLEEWTEDREAALIAQSLFCFLPVSAQGFSVVKSLNRAVTTLSGGAQVLSAGFPLYAPLDAFIYRDPLELLADLKNDRLRLRQDTVPHLATLLESTGNPQTEARGLLGFLTALPVFGAMQHGGLENGKVAVIHGIRTTSDIHKALQRIGCLTVSSPYSSTKLGCDIEPRFDPAGQFVDVILSQRAANLLDPAFLPRLEDRTTPDDKPRFRLRLSQADIPTLGPVVTKQDPPRRLDMLESYPRAMAQVVAVLRCLFGDVTVFTSELASPYRFVPAPAATLAA